VARSAARNPRHGVETISGQGHIAVDAAAISTARQPAPRCLDIGQCGLGRGQQDLVDLPHRRRLAVIATSLGLIADLLESKPPLRLDPNAQPVNLINT
jgi:hypothetical protein